MIIWYFCVHVTLLDGSSVTMQVIRASLLLIIHFFFAVQGHKWYVTQCSKTIIYYYIGNVFIYIFIVFRCQCLMFRNGYNTTGLSNKVNIRPLLLSPENLVFNGSSQSYGYPHIWHMSNTVVHLTLFLLFIVL